MYFQFASVLGPFLKKINTGFMSISDRSYNKVLAPGSVKVAAGV